MSKWEVGGGPHKPTGKKWNKRLEETTRRGDSKSSLEQLRGVEFWRHHLIVRVTGLNGGLHQRQSGSGGSNEHLLPSKGP
jgi:hypothetical protein